ncbi:ATPase [Halobacteriales archaeon SW_7_68_16]|nr:MAG: ATPase [Halobacteriales archaeon SW_7_68_16]
MNLLVAGADRVDAGKTTFSMGLVDEIGGMGYKPRAGNDYWFDHDDYRTAVAEGRLYGKDAARLAAASAAEVRPEMINPIHRLWRPAPGTGTGIVGRENRAFVCDRVEDRFVVAASATVPESADEALPLADAERVDDLRALNAVTERLYLPALARVRDRIAGTDRAVVESYGDIAAPLRGVTDDDERYDAVAVVEPARVRVYDGRRYVRACAAVGGPGDRGTGTLEERVEDVIGRIDPVATVSLPALDGETRSDPGAVADAYSVAYEAVLAAATR